MDSATRRAILNKVAETSVPLREATGKPPVIESALPESDKIYQYRRDLKRLKAFESQLKKDAEDFDDSDWKAFEESIKPKTTVDCLEGMFARREMREKQEAEEKRKLRSSIFEKINMDLMKVIK